EDIASKLTGQKNCFDWRIYFNEVFKNHKGFDVVIANPPYVRQEKIKPFKPQLKEAFGDFFCGTADLYTYFYKKGVEILCRNGHLCYIAPNKFFRANYGNNLRQFLSGQAVLLNVIDFEDAPIFKSTTYPSILLVQKYPPPKDAKAQVATIKDMADIENLGRSFPVKSFAMPQVELSMDCWQLERSHVLALLKKLKDKGTPLGEYVDGAIYYGIKTGRNEAFVIDKAKRDELIAADPKSAEVIKPWLRGEDIKRWRVEYAEKYVINIQSSSNKAWPWSEAKQKANAEAVFKEIYPAIHAHLIKWRKKLKKRDDQGRFYWELRSCAYNSEFEKPKIVYPNIWRKNTFFIDRDNFFTNQKCFIIPVDDPFLLSFLNSTCAIFWGTAVLPKLRGNFFEPSAVFFKQLPIPPVTDAQRKALTNLVQRILDAKDADPSADVTPWEKEIDRIVYQLFDLTDQEIVLVESRCG
ncbi:MAG: Eco57I restriction-modification methylase domain-containing protein, partial [Alphaproteobacteria bacterium]